MAEVTTYKRYMSVKEVAEYLHLNEKKIYLLASEGRIPGTKITGKWIFPRELVDQWVLSSSHGGLLTDKLIISGTDDSLLPRVIRHISEKIGANGLISYSSSNVQLGLQLLQRNKIDICCLRWGPSRESDIRHPALLQGFEQHRDWILIRAFSRQQGLILSPSVKFDSGEFPELFNQNLRWADRPKESGGLRIFQESLPEFRHRIDQLNVVATAIGERHAASMVAMKIVDIVPGAKSAATEFGLNFLPMCWENIDFVMRRKTYFRTLFQKLLENLLSYNEALEAGSLGGYDLSDCGRIIWCYDEY